MAKSKSSFVCSTSFNPDLEACALFINTSILPYSSTTCFYCIFYLVFISTVSYNRQYFYIIFVFKFFFLLFKSVDSVLPVIARFDPAFANAVAIPNPIPFPPPVIIVTFPFLIVVHKYSPLNINITKYIYHDL